MSHVKVGTLVSDNKVVMSCRVFSLDDSKNPNYIPTSGRWYVGQVMIDGCYFDTRFYVYPKSNNPNNNERLLLRKFVASTMVMVRGHGKVYMPSRVVSAAESIANRIKKSRTYKKMDRSSKMLGPDQYDISCPKGDERDIDYVILRKFLYETQRRATKEYEGQELPLTTKHYNDADYTQLKKEYQEEVEKRQAAAKARYEKERVYHSSYRPYATA